jgi:hypothetical protein
MVFTAEITVENENYWKTNMCNITKNSKMDYIL